MRRNKFKLKIKEVPIKDEDRKLCIDMFLRIKKLHEVSKKVKPDCRLLIQKEIQELRILLNNKYCFIFYHVTIFLGPHKENEWYSYFPNIEDINSLKEKLVKRLSKQRSEKKQMHFVKKNFAGIEYNMLAPSNHKIFINPNLSINNLRNEKPNIMRELIGAGAVFNEPGSILKLATNESYARRITKSKVPYDNSNFIGVELELICSVDRARLNDLFVKDRLAGQVHIKHDGSIQVEAPGQFEHEVTIIAKQENINSVIERVCKILNSSDVKGYVNNSCGLHVHVDMRNRNPKHCYKNLFYTLGIMSAMVPPNRTNSDHGTRYCKINKNLDFDVTAKDRYHAINSGAFYSHKTLEVRIHSGTINAMKINNWINLIVSIVEKKEELTQYVINIDDMKSLFNISDELITYIKLRTNKFKDKNLDTRKDHFETAI